MLGGVGEHHLLALLVEDGECGCSTDAMRGKTDPVGEGEVAGDGDLKFLNHDCSWSAG